MSHGDSFRDSFHTAFFHSPELVGKKQISIRGHLERSPVGYLFLSGKLVRLAKHAK